MPRCVGREPVSRRPTGFGLSAVTVQICGDLGTIRPLVEGQPSTEFPLQTVSVPSNVNSYLPPGRVAKQRGEGMEYGYNRVGQGEHRLAFFQEGPASLPCSYNLSGFCAKSSLRPRQPIPSCRRPSETAFFGPKPDWGFWATPDAKTGRFRRYRVVATYALGGELDQHSSPAAKAAPDGPDAMPAPQTPECRKNP